MVKLSLLSFAVLLGAVTEVAAQTKVKVMPFGASIMTGCWRRNLNDKLIASGNTNFDFVGNQNGGDCGGTFDRDHEGHPGFQVTNVANNNLLVGWLSTTKPDVVLIHIGTNDIVLNTPPKSTADIMNAYSKLIDQMRASKPTMKIIISTLLPLSSRFKQEQRDAIVAVNSAIKYWGPRKSTAASPVTVVDNFAGFDAVADTTDGQHPNASGNEKFASKFFPATVSAVQAVSRRQRWARMFE